MGGAAEILERAEHAAHAGHSDHKGHGDGHGGTSTGKYIGITMACLGVLLAFCSAMVGGQRTELVQTMVEQSNAHVKYQSQAMKYRILVAQVQALGAGIPRAEEKKELDATFARIEHEVVEAAKKAGASGAAPAASGEKAPAGSAAPVAGAPPANAPKADGSSDATALIVGLRETAKTLLEHLTPRKPDVARFVHLVRKFRKERDIANKWVEAFEPAVHAHAEAAEHYEWAQLCSEIGIVVASIALLFSSRKVWSVSLILGAAALVIVGTTFVQTRSHLLHSEHEVEELGKEYTDLRKTTNERAEDEKMLHDLQASLGMPIIEEDEPPAKPAGEAPGQHGPEKGHGEH